MKQQRAPGLLAAALMLLLVLGVTALVFGGLVGVLLLVPGAERHLIDGLALAVALHGMLAAGVVVGWTRRSGVPLAALGCVRPTWRMLHLLWQIPVVATAAVLVQGIVVALTEGAAQDGGGGASSELADASPFFAVVGFAGVALLTPLWEELALRGVVFGSVRARWGTAAAVLLSSALFAAVHLHPLLMPYLLVFGLGAAWLRVFHRNVWAPMVLHASINSIAASVILTAL